MHNYGHWKKTLALLVMSALSLGASSVDAMPEGGVIRSGEGAVSQNGKEMTIRQDSGRLAMDWTNFNVGKDETVRFQQPGKDALALNRVTGNQQSVIDGSLLSNGHVLLVNPNGVVIGKNASIDVGGLVASTANVKDNFMKEFGNSTGSFNLGGVSDGKIINESTINAEGGLVALHAAKVENSGTIKSNGGSVLMAAADTLTLTPDADGKLNFTVDGKVAEASALNKGAITADGGTIVMTADSASDVMSTVVNNEGTLQARTLRKNEKGQILLEGNDKGQVEVSGTLDASGTDDGQDAGNIKVIGQKTIVHDGTNLLARGDVNGGKIETSGNVLDLGDNLNIDAAGVNGKHGEWLLDPLEVLIQDEQPIQSSMDRTEKTVNGGSETQITYNDPPSATANADSTYASTSWIKTSLITDILKNGTDVTIQAASTSQAASITVNSAITPIIGGDGEATLELDAQRNITINKEIKANSSGGKLNVKLNSDTDGDGVGAVIINADISTNGGTFTSGSGGNVVYDATVKDANGNTVYQKDSSGKYVTNSQTGEKVPEYKTAGYITDGVLSGSPQIDGHTVGTYFGYITPAGKTVTGYSENRNITTNGGDINLYGEVAIGLNGGTLTLDTSKTGGNGGSVNITGIVNSGNSYEAYIYGTDKWNELVKKLVQQYLDHETVPSYHFIGINYTYTKNADGTYSYTTEAKHFNQGESHYAFNELTKKDVNGTNWTYTKSEPTLDTQHTRWYATTTAGDGYNSFIMEGTTPENSQMSIDEWLIYYRRTEPGNYAAKYANGNTDTKTNLVTYDTIKNDATKLETLKSDISALIAHNWFASETLAKSGTGANAGDSYLATITTALENSLSTPNSQKTLWVGGMGSGVRNKTNDKKTNPYSQYPSDPSHQDGFYWVTGPEGLVTNEKGTTGTKFWDTSSSDWSKGNYGSQVYGYTKWSSWSGGGQPDNSAPFLTVGYGNNNAWDDAAIDGGTTVGFVQETNLYNSSLNIKTAGGKVTLQGDIGKSVGLDTVNIDAGSGSVTTGNTNNTATKYNNGTIYADHGVYINGSDVTVGGEIHSGGSSIEATRNTTWVGTDADKMDNVTINASRNLTVHGIESNGYTTSSTDAEGNTTSTTAGGKIKLVSTGDKGKITLGAGVDYDGNATAGTLAAASADKGAVVIDAQGSQGSLVNSTTGKDAITTGTDVTTGAKGTWQVYVNSPSDYGTILGSNLKSGTNAQWTAKSTANTTVTTNSSSNTLEPYTDTRSNKFIFQVTPVITISGGYASKTYGDTLSEEAMAKTLTSKAVYKDSTQKDIDVTSFKNFDESNYLTYVTSSDGTKTGLSTVSVSSDGAATTATRTKGNEKVKGTDGKETNEYKKADDGNRAFYIMDVTYQYGVKTLNGYDKAANDGEVEIKRKTLTIKTDATQNYGDSAITLGTPSPYESQLVGKDKLNANDITYSISTTGDYAKSKGTNPTAHVREGGYSDEYLTTGAAIKDGDGNDASANYEVAGSGTIKVNPADLYLTVGDVSTTYGTPFKTNEYKYTIDTTKSVGLVNGDTEASLGVDDSFLKYTNTGDASDPDKIAKGAITQNVGDYELKGTANKTLTDYSVHITNGKSVVNPKDINIYAEGNGSTLSDVTWTKIEKDKLVNGDSWDNGFTFSVEPGDLISYAEKTFGIKGYVNGQPISDGTQIGNYIYHPTGKIQLTFNPIVKPDVWAHSGGYRPRNKIETSLPVFRVEDAKVGQYGTYGVEHREDEDKLVLSATGMRLPEPDQVPDEERTFTTTLSTSEGSGTFTLEYNGVSLKVHPQDKEAEEVVRAGDKTKNVSLSEKALYVGYTEMGLDLIDLKGVYIYFN
ncbi:filamentous hemagglutinin N-terminal domain-containing protein [uncultured Dialister sp.]|uniref:two-partner secretion domain-containing protein n=1 Tax=uncultured Dialister sp. TaxID=278064 RepID=UPI0025CD9C4D|nr:filamentous hemagglutinin N-terminal domain-containing protein [uncultured Dialister sp.]